MIKPAEGFRYDPEDDGFEENNGAIPVRGFDPALHDFDDDLEEPGFQPIDLTPVVNQTREFFLPEGPLKNSEEFGGRPFEYRPQQAEMANQIAEAFRGQHNLCVEAPTGVGKSLAYLVPAILYSIRHPRPVVISTETINLQEQLIKKDIPLLAKMLGVDFKAALAKGRGNYLCLRRFNLASGEGRGEYLPRNSCQVHLEKIAEWAATTETGDRGEMRKVDEETWSYVCCESGGCAGEHKCPFGKECFYWRVRETWEQADVIVTNHAMFFIDLKMKELEQADPGSFLLPRYCGTIVDEAHTMENSAAEYLGLRLSSIAVYSTLNRLFNPKTGRGILVKPGDAALKLRTMVTDLGIMAAAYFDFWRDYIERTDEDIRSITAPDIAPEGLRDAFIKFCYELAEYNEELEEKMLKAEITGYHQRCSSFADILENFQSMLLQPHVYWAELDNKNIVLRSAPLNVNEMLYELLFSKEFPTILTSATLSVNRNLNYYRSRVGYGNGGELILDSPFDPRQVTVLLPKEMPEPNHSNYFSALLEKLQEYIMMTNGKAFVLFTSHAMLRSCADRLQGFFLEKGINLLVHDRTLNRTELLKEFKEDVNSVLFGTDSFWTGVDVPGEALSNVIVAKLPFAVPSHPLIKARCERIEASGGKAFMDYSLPEAILKFRQGVGRLVRSKTDTGYIVLLDRRITSKFYGRWFLDSLPAHPIKYV